MLLKTVFNMISLLLIKYVLFVTIKQITPKVSSSKQGLFSHIVSEGQDVSAGQLWLRGSQEVADQLSAEAVVT